MALSKLLSAIFLLSALLILGSCAPDDEFDIKCPDPSEISGQYVFCVIEQIPLYGPDDEDIIDRSQTTSTGIYPAGTEVTAVAKPCGASDCGFYGWFDAPFEDGGEMVSYANPYVFHLVEDTYLWAEYIGGY